MKSVRLIITGRVQGVGYRDWMVSQARRLGLRGWVRNLGMEKVEAVITGEDGAVATCIAVCRHGPPLAVVAGIAETPCPPPEDANFTRHPSVTEPT